MTHTLPPTPEQLTVALARSATTASAYIPLPLLRACASLLGEHSRAVTDDVHAHRGRRGNPALREQADSDRASAHQLHHNARWRAYQLSGSELRDAERSHDIYGSTYTADELAATQDRLTHARAVENHPPLGPTQWSVIAQLTPGWSGTPDQLHQTVQAMTDPEPPLDLDDWRHHVRRELWAARSARLHTDAAAARRDVERLIDQQRRLQQHLQQLTEQLARDTTTALTGDDAAAAIRRATALPNSALADWEKLVDAGATYTDALKTVTAPDTDPADG